MYLVSSSVCEAVYSQLFRRENSSPPHAETIVSFYMDMRFRLTQVRHPALDETRRRSHHGRGEAALRPMRIKLTVKRVEIVAPFYMDMRFRLTLARYVPHMVPDVGRTLTRRGTTWAESRRDRPMG